MAIHQFDLARDLIGAEPVSVYCDSYNPAWSWFGGDAAANAVFEFDGGARFSFTGSWCAPGLETSWNGRWRVSAERRHRPLGRRRRAGRRGRGRLGAAGRGRRRAGADRRARWPSSSRVLRDGGVPSGEVHANVLSLAMVEAATTSADVRAGG